MDKIVDQYLNYLNQSTDNLNFILGDIELFTGNTNYVKVHELFQNIYDLRVKIQVSARHFRYYKNREGNKAVVLSEILELQNNIFKVEESENLKIIYRKFGNMMELKLEEFRAKIIYNIEPDKIKIIPIEISKKIIKEFINYKRKSVKNDISAQKVKVHTFLSAILKMYIENIIIPQNIP